MDSGVTAFDWRPDLAQKNPINGEYRSIEGTVAGCDNGSIWF